MTVREIKAKARRHVGRQMQGVVERSDGQVLHSVWR